MKHIYTFFGILCLLHVLPAQNCPFGDPVPIPDDRSIRAVQREVNLQSSSQKVLCAVQLSFEHEYAEELRFELISPAGKKLTLINGHTASAHTENSTWDIRFVRHEEQARPDPFQKEFWNENNWKPDREYTGSYYPEDPNGLEIFDGEKTIGVWSLVYQDLVKGAAGTLIDFQLVFCDARTTCHPCDLSANFISEEPERSYCGGDQNLKQISPLLLEDNLQSGFDYYFLATDSLNNIVDGGKTIDLSQNPAGKYRITGIQIRPENLHLIEEARTWSDILELLDKIQPNICGVLSSNSLKITILSNIDPQVDTMEIYGRESIVFDEELIARDTQLIIQSTDENHCLITRQVDILFKEYEHQFIQSDTYDCDHTAITLFVQNSMNFPVHRWFTRDGIISNQSKTDTDEIIVEAPGTYYVILEIDDYLDTLSYTLKTNPSTPVFLLENEYTLCYNDTLQLPIGKNYDEVKMGESSTAQINNGILIIHEPGLYSLELHKDDCIIRKNLLIIPPPASDEIRLPDEKLTCMTQSIQVDPILEESYDHYEWFFQNKKIENQKAIGISKPGYYTLQAYNTGDCGVTATLWVDDQTAPFDLSISGPDLLHCQNIHSNNQLKIKDPGPYHTLWIAPDGSISENTSISITTEGIYRVEVEDDEGCIHTAEKKVSVDTTGFTLIAPDKFTLPCTKDEDHSIKIEVHPEFRGYKIEWKGAQKEGTDLFATPNKPGEVQVTVTNRESRCTETKTIEVENHPDKPAFKLGPESRVITCENPMREVSFDYENCEECKVEFITKPDGITFDQEQKIITATKAGEIEILLTNQEGCQHTETIRFTENTRATPLDAHIQHIGCEERQGRIRINNEEIYSQIQIRDGSEDLGLNSLFSDPVTLKAIYTDRTNGCIDSTELDIELKKTLPKIGYDPVVYLNCHSGEATLSIDVEDKVNITWKNPHEERITEDKITVTDPGKYVVYAKNENGCTTTESIEVIEDRDPPAISIEKSYEIPCSSSTEGFSISYDTTHLAGAQWYGSRGWTSTEFYPILPFAGEYRLVVTGKNGCSSTEIIKLKEEEFGQIPKIEGSLITCAQPSSSVRLDDYSQLDEILWIDDNGHSSREKEFEVFNPGTIKASVRNKSGCRTTIQYKLERDIETVPFNINRPTIDCATPTPEMRVQIQKENFTRSNISYTWYQDDEYFGDESKIKVDRPGNYKVIVENHNGCRDSLSYTVRIDTIKPTVQMIPDTINCRRSKIQLPSEIKTNNIRKAVWRGPDNFYSEEIRPGFTTPGRYTVMFTGENGCHQQEDFHIFDDTKSPVIDSVDFLSLGCDGATVPLQFYTQDEYTEQYWLLPDQSVHEKSIIQIDEPGEYILYLQSKNYCTTIDTLLIDEQIIPEFTVEIDDVNCVESTGSALIIPQREDFVISWSTDAGATISDGLLSPPLLPGSYMVTVSDPRNQCDSILNFDITDLSKIMEIEIMIDDSLRCERNQANLLSSVFPKSINYTYEWKIDKRNHVLSRDSIAAGIVEEGWYTLTVKDTVTHCMETDSFLNIRAHSTLKGFDMSISEPACHIDQPGRAIIHQIKGALDDDQMRFSLDGKSFYNKDTFGALYANTPYTIHAKDQYGCQIDTMLFLELRGVMDKIGGIKDTVINKGDVINLNDPAFKMEYSSADDPMDEKYEWRFPPDVLACGFSCDEEVNAYFHETRFGTSILTNEYGCTMTDTFYVYVAESEVINIPTGIIPASSQKENAHACIYTNEYISNIKLYVVFDLQGSVIYRKTNFDPRKDTEFQNCWNGRDQQGQILPQGNYTYYVQYETVYGAAKEKYGNFFLLR